MIGIIGAMPEEVSGLVEKLQGKNEKQIGPFTLHLGSLKEHKVMIAQCGISKVNAAALTQVMILEGVKQIIFTGVAGAINPKLKVGDIVISHDCLQYDVNVSALGYQLGVIPGESLSWQADQTLKTLALNAAQTLKGRSIEGRILSGDQFIASIEKVNWLRETFNGDCAEMEGAAVAQICSRWSIPFVIIRSISDTANHDANTDFKAFTQIAAEQAKSVVLGMLNTI